ncbi:hypothetical protein [Halobaculum limi]|uniref:hypothetical protein n=1 Tax=Halobaculum limi TaxID=3031916 RepID=UPI002405E000|nr:hypothetical protein [Halobaculum sp. YSMS11]
MGSKKKIPSNAIDEHRFCEAPGDDASTPCGDHALGLYEVNTVDGSYTYRWLCRRHANHTDHVPHRVDHEMITGLLRGLLDYDINSDLVDGITSGLNGGADR